jgi:hypothetical protein
MHPRKAKHRANPIRGVRLMHDEHACAHVWTGLQLLARLALFLGLIGAAILGAASSRLGAAEAVQGFGKLGCRASRSEADDKACFRKAAASVAPQGAWKLLRSHDPSGGPDAISVIRTAEPSRSDPDIAGLMLRCAGSDIEALVIVIEPRPPRARPRIDVSANGARASFEATVAPPFTALLLPKEAAALLTGPWASAPELAITVDGEHSPEHGTVLLAGIRQALDRLTIACASH